MHPTPTHALSLPLLLIAALAAPAAAADGVTGGGRLPQTVEFNRHIRPVLSDVCFGCHGPGEPNRQADLRLDRREQLYKDSASDLPIVTPGDPHKSELYRRITSDDEFTAMPPPEAPRQLTDHQKALFRRWIEQGAAWQKHWSFLPPVKRPLPEVHNSAWIQNPIDAWVLARLEREGLQPSPQAEKTRLIRRVTLDLTGLPPTPSEIDAFLADDSPAAYEKVVDRLLRSARYGERMAIGWLDAARYADTSGYQNDGPRSMWRWRDWVIEAFNANMPFDRFTVEQIAGDMLPGATLEQRVATGFNRNHRGNAEGGIIPEEYQVEYVVDRVETTFTVFQGLTLGCARCHEHKYDPFSQEEFYRVFAYFNNIPEHGRAIKEGNSPPYIQAPTEAQQKELAALERKLSAAENRYNEMQPELAVAQRAWEQTFATEERIEGSVTEGLIAHFSFDGTLGNAAAEKGPPVECRDGEAVYEAGRIDKSAAFDGQRYIDAGDVADFGYFDKFSFGAWIYPTGDRGGTILSRMTDLDQADGYALVLKGGKVQLNLVKRWLDDCIRVESAESVPPDEWSHVFITYDGSRVAEGITIAINGVPSKLKVNLDGINQSFANGAEPLRIGGGNGPEGRFHGRIDDVRIYDRALTETEIAITATLSSIGEIVSLPSEERSAGEREKLRAYFIAHAAPETMRTAQQEVRSLRRELAAFTENLPTVMVMQELQRPRETFVLQRGRYDEPGERVRPGVPASLSPWPEGAPDNRLGFARWLVSRENPLTARVAVNRFWQMLFGTGLVETAEDFGSQGQPPSHPDLLDWLAVEFMQSGWDVKGILKTIVMSATYRQSSRARPELIERDPENRLLARGPRFRLPAEVIRDQALAVSGLLSERIGGPSVKPYQPDGLWKEIATTTNYEQSQGADLYRRSLYTYWKRTVAPPTMMNFDAGAREYCTVQRPRTNTPLQALTLMNDVTFVEAARVLAERVMTEGGKTAEERIAYAFRLCTARRPEAEELAILEQSLADSLQRFRENPQAAGELLSAGEAPRNESLDAADVAAYTTLCSLILNLDEVVTKE